ncbi:MAG: UPF0182 family protein [Clostridia bacterium]|nr:UPF0182 family protein [Clostridia bacterium]
MSEEKSTQDVEKAEKAENTVDTKLDEKKDKQRRRKLRFILSFVAFLIFGAVYSLWYRGEYLKYLEIGEKYIDVFQKKITNVTRFYFVTFLISYFVIYISNKITIRGLKVFFKEEGVTMPRLLNKSLAFSISIITALIATKVLYNNFELFANGAMFGRYDPVFGYDFGVFLFKFPFVKLLLLFLMIYSIALIGYIGLYYVIVFNKFFDGVDGETLSKSVFIKQIVMLVVIAAICLSGFIYISAESNLTTQTMLTVKDEVETEIIGAGKVDVSIKVWGYRILSIVVFLGIMGILRATRKNDFRQSMVCISAVVGYFIILFVVMVAYNGIVLSDEFDAQKSYIAENIKATKDAYGIDIEQNVINQYETISLDELKANQDIISNIPVINKDTTLQMISEHQENGIYYSYDYTDLAEYNNQLMYLTPREIEETTKINEKAKVYEYTHGYSVVASTVSDADKNGYAEYIVSGYDDENALNITEPRIYFGRNTNNSIVTNVSKYKEYDYPTGATTYEEFVYNGRAGLHYEFKDRLVIALRDKNFGLIFPTGYTEESKIITNRNVIERAKTLLPGVLYDEEPYLVINKEGRLIWVVDGYTRSENYPYSQKTTINIKGYKEKINYIRNSVKVLIDAYNGTVSIYIVDRNDPVIMTYYNEYPELFMDTNIPEDILAHMKYPKFLYNIQANMLNIYHDISIDTLYRGEDVWVLTPKTNSTTSVKTSSYYTKLKTIDDTKSKNALITTYNKYGKQNIAAYLVANYTGGKPSLKLYKFGPECNVIGIAEMNTKIDQDETISKKLEQLNLTGTILTKEMYIVPINRTFLYIEPVYQVKLNEKSNIPVLKSVIVASGTTVAIGDTLEEALANLFTDYAVDLEFVDTENIGDLVDSLVKANDNLTASMESQDFSLIGKDISSLQSIIKQLENARAKEKAKEEEEKANSESSGILESLFDRNNEETVNNTVNTVENNTTDITNNLVENVVENKTKVRK